MKSTTAPNRSRSITLPIAPPAMAPNAMATSRFCARDNQTPSAPTTRRETPASTMGPQSPRRLNSPKVTPWFHTMVKLSTGSSTIWRIFGRSATFSTHHLEA